MKSQYILLLSLALSRFDIPKKCFVFNLILAGGGILDGSSVGLQNMN